MGLGISRKQMVMVATLLSGTLLTVLNLTLMTPALPTIMSDMSVTVGMAGGSGLPGRQYL